MSHDPQIVTAVVLVVMAVTVWGYYEVSSRSVWREYREMRDCSDPLRRIYASRVAAVKQTAVAMQTMGFSAIIAVVVIGKSYGIFTGWESAPALVGLFVATLAWEHVRTREVMA